MIIEQRRKGGDAGKPAAVERIEPVGNRSNISGIKPAFMAAVEGIAFRTDAGKQVWR